MQTSTPSIGKIGIVVGFALTCIVIAALLWRAFGGETPLEAKPYRIAVQVPSADALFYNSDVRVAGVKVGRIDQVKQSGRTADLVLDIDQKYAPIRNGARAMVRSKSLLGEGYIELAPGPVTAAPIADGGRLRTANVAETQRLDDVLETFAPETRADIRKMFAGTARAFDGRAGDVNETLGTAAPTFRNLSGIIDELRDQMAPTRRLLSSADGVFRSLAADRAALSAAVREGDRVFSATASRDQALEATVRRLPDFLGRLKSASAEIGSASGDLDRAVTALQPTVDRLHPAVLTFANDLPAFEKGFRELAPTLARAESTLPALTRTLGVTTDTAEPIYQSLREAIPFLKLLSESRRSLVANFAIVSAFVNGKAIGTNGRITGSAGATLTFWNEIIGGYTKRLPTNTSNPYPRPGSSDEIGTKGGLPAYDCRHTKNPLIVPPFGSAPPCRLQGPWTFDGKTAYFPRLERDDP